MHKLVWIEGAPAELKAGMLVQWGCGSVALVGHIDELHCEVKATDFEMASVLGSVMRHAWLVKTHELDWIGAMAPKVSR